MMIVMAMLIVVMMLMVLHNLLQFLLCDKHLGLCFWLQTMLLQLAALINNLGEPCNAGIHLWTNQITNTMTTLISRQHKYTHDKYNMACFMFSVLFPNILGLAHYHVPQTMLALVCSVCNM